MVNLKIVTFNIRFMYDSVDGINCFIHRAAMIADKIEAEKPDIICFQEVTPPIKAFLEKALDKYMILGQGREVNYTGEGVFTALKKDVIDLIGLEQFWFSDTPYVTGSKHVGQSEYPRVGLVALVKHRDSVTPFRIFNVHLDSKPEREAIRVLEIKQLLEKIKSENDKFNTPFVTLGDFNSTPDRDTYSYCLGFNDYPMVDVTTELGGSHHGFGRLAPEERKKIDYIFFDENTAKTARNVHFWDDEKDGIYLSDHYPISCEFTLAE